MSIQPLPSSVSGWVTVKKPLDVQLSYGRVRINAGAKLKVVSRDGVLVNVTYMNATVAIPVSATDLQ
jgi:hypothetical protein